MHLHNLSETKKDIFVEPPRRSEVDGHVALTRKVYDIETREDGWTYGTIYYKGQRLEIMYLDKRWVLI